MKRKLFSAILFGALLATSTSGLTSCKDYDDDITNLQGQIDKLATKDELSTKANELANSISAAQQSATAAKDAADKALVAANGASSAADAAAKAAKTAQDAADKVAGDLKTAVENAAQQIQDAVKDLATKQQVTDAVKEVKDKYDAQAKELKALSDRLAKVEAKLGMEEGGEDIDLTEIQEELDLIEAALIELVGDVSTMVTGIEVVENALVYGSTVYDAALDFNIVQEKDNVFGEGVTNGKFTFSKTNTFAGSDEVLIRVNPVNADLTNYKEHISLINSQGAELNDFVEVESVERYNGLLSRAANDQTGLWIVKFVPKDNISVEAFENAVTTVKNSTTYNVLHAVAIKNSCDNDTINESLDAARRVVSQYVVTAGYKNVAAYNGQPKDNLTLADYNDFTVNGTPIIALRNRITAADYSWNTDKTWKPRGGTPWTGTGSNQQAVGPATSMVIYDASTMTNDNKAKVVNSRNDGTYSDNRDNTNNVTITTAPGTTVTKKRDYLVVDLNEAINIEYPANKKIKGFYVALDYANAQTVSSGSTDPSELNAWNSYTYEGVAKFDKDGKIFNNTVATLFEGNKATIRVSDFNGEAMNDIIGFRVFAVNLDGTLLDPDGVAFYVSVGKKGGENTLAAQTINVTEGNASVVDGTITAAYNGKNVTGDIDVTDLFKDAKNIGSSATGAVTWTCSKGADTVTPKIDGTTARNDYAYTIWYHNVAGNGGTPAAGWNQVFDPTKTYDKIRVQILKPQAFVDDATYTLTATVNGKSNSTDYTLRTIKVDVTKAMPSEVPPFRFKPGQTEQQLVVDNSPTYPYAVTNGKKDATIDLKNIFVRTDGTLLNADPNFTVKLAESKWNTNRYVDLTGTNYVYTLAPKTNASTTNELVDGGVKSHAVVGSYTWGNISRRVNNGTYQSLEYTLPIVNNYNLKYYSWSETEQPGYQSYSWKPITSTVNGQQVVTGYEDKVTIAATTTLKLTNIVAATGDKSASYFEKANLDAYYAAGTEWLKIDKVTLTTDGLENVYFTGAADACTTANGNTITFTAVQDIDNIPAHTAAMVIQMHDCFGYKSYVKLNLRFVK